jgi:uncharacterized protein YuzE
MIDMTYDPEADAVYMYIGHGGIDRTEEAGPFIYDVDAEGRVLGIEILHVSEVRPLGPNASTRWVYTSESPGGSCRRVRALGLPIDRQRFVDRSPNGPTPGVAVDDASASNLPDNRSCESILVNYRWELRAPAG